MANATAAHHDDHGTPRGIARWLYSTNHKDIGTMYLIFSIIAGIIGGAASVYMRMELQQPGIQYMSDGHEWNMVVTAHGLIMVFFVVMPGLIGGFGNWFVPLMIGAPDMAFPRMNNISFWLLIPAFTLLILSAILGGGAEIGFDEYSGWLVMNLANMEKGLIVIKVHTWIEPIEATEKWCSVNNKEPCKQRALEPETSGHVSRKLGPPYCDDFALEVAVDGKITKLPHKANDSSSGIYVKAQRVVELFELYNDDDFGEKRDVEFALYNADDFGEKRDVEFALRMTGCGRQKPFGLTHVYWI